jgi:hypothetical protein
MPLEEVKRGRAGKPKTRTGCKTCKRRRVKCDESKPACRRCMKFGITCDGYEAEVMPPQRRPKPLICSNPDRVLLPRGQLPIQWSHIRTPLSHHPTLMPEMDRDEDYLCLQYFHERSFHEFNDGPWMEVMLQASYSEPTIQCLMSSVAALCRATYASTPGQDSTRHLQHAYHRYGQAVRGIRLLASTSGLGSAKTLLQASLLIFVFEMLQGNMLTAFSHLRSTFKSLILQWLPDKGLLPYTHIRPATQYAFMDPEMMASFARLDVQLCSHPLNPFPSKSTLLGIAYNSEPYVIPNTFQDLKTARIYLEDIIQRVRAGIPDSFNVARDQRKRSIENRSCWSKRCLSDAEANIIQSQVLQWQSALLPIYQRSLTPAGSHELVRASILYVQSLSTSLVLQRFRAQSNPNIGTPLQFQERQTCLEIIEMCRKAARHKDFMTFVVHEGFLRSLFLVGILTTEADIKHEVLAVLKEMGQRREGVWNVVAVRWAVEASFSSSNGQDAEGRQEKCKCKDSTMFNRIFETMARGGDESLASLSESVTIFKK